MRRMIIPLILVLCMNLHGCWLVDLWMESKTDALVTPETGEYICTDCDARLRFAGDDITIQYSDGFLETVYIDYGDRLHGSETHFISSYFWEKWMDVIKLTIRKDTAYFADESTHLFLRK